jgi:hypothetical protein
VRVVADDNCKSCNKKLNQNELIVAVGKPCHALYHYWCLPYVDLKVYPHPFSIKDYHQISQEWYERRNNDIGNRSATNGTRIPP